MAVADSLNKRKKMMLWSGLFILLAVIVLPMSGYIAIGMDPSQQGDTELTNPRADTWRQVRRGVEGYTAVTGQEANELIQGSGENWRRVRNGPMATYGSWLLGGVLLAILIFYTVRGKVKLTHPRTGETVERWSLNERRLHWVTAILFIILAITGLSLLYGRQVLIPLLGHGGFSWYATGAKFLHNALGPVFMITLFAILVAFFKHNFFNRVDLEWFKAFGGMVGDKHPSAGRMNGGEKLWYWTLAIAGVALCLSGLVLDFPNFGQERQIIQLAHVIHLATALLLIAFSFGHIYIGTIGTEGALEGMTTGQVDVAWAEQHHDLWLQEIREKNGSSSQKPD
jgi:formate dehydrogenase subunit gamma